MRVIWTQEKPVFHGKYVHIDGLLPEQLTGELVHGGVRVRELVLERPSLERVFLDLTTGGDDVPR